MRGIPEDRLMVVYASGSYSDPRLVQADGNSYFDVVGGIDVYRYDPKDEPKVFPVNQDHYIVVVDPAEDDLLLVAGPIEDDHKWLKTIPDKKPDIVIYEFDKETEVDE